MPSPEFKIVRNGDFMSDDDEDYDNDDVDNDKCNKTTTAKKSKAKTTITKTTKNKVLELSGDIVPTTGPGGPEAAGRLGGGRGVLPGQGQAQGQGQGQDRGSQDPSGVVLEERVVLRGGNIG